ncbi:hypothetical protein RF11_08264 [Thelohanellus kitauei]|uniref:Uncharacterized protein n=1 Tax=Thelohanellus kitauei TaxID=669202 RepID=A0A0C2JAW3_THEKT|nr:hypothetical protein RF11_08264 [Thelohanellus kitauei]
MSTASMIIFACSLFTKLTTSENVTTNCTGIDDKIMMITVYFLYQAQRYYCSQYDVPYKDWRIIEYIQDQIKRHLNCSVVNFQEFVHNYYKNRINCTEYFDEWFENIGFDDILDKNSCNFRDDLDIYNDLTTFAAYLRNRSISQENYTRMIISAMCNLDQAHDEFYRSKSKYKAKRDDFLKYVIKILSTTQVNHSIESFLIQQVQERPEFKNWIPDRYLLKILQCYIQNGYLNISINLLLKSSDKISDVTVLYQMLAPYMYLVGFISIGMIIIVFLHNIYGILKRDNVIHYQGDDFNWIVKGKYIPNTI